MDRPSKARRRFHTDRIVAKQRARYFREWPFYRKYDSDRWLSSKLAYGRLASTDPWDCGRPRCGVCHFQDGGRRAREKQTWRRDWGL